MFRFLLALNILIASILISTPAWAKSRGSVVNWQPGHSQDMAMVVGLTQDSPQAQKAKWESITAEFAVCIDSKEDAAACARMIKQELPAFSWHKYGHRIFFHWGFNSFPYSISDYKRDVSSGGGRCENALVQCIEEALQAEPEEKRNELRERVWLDLRSIQSTRNGHMMRIIPAADRATKNGIAAILYDVHLLGDYIQGTEETSKALYPLAKVLGDIIHAVERIKVKDEAPKRKLLQELRRVSIPGGAYVAKGTAEQQAAKILDILIKGFPAVVKQSPSHKMLIGE